MQTSRPTPNQHRSLSQRRGLPDLARFSLDLTWARAESERPPRAKAYPSPPMSGSPPLPPKPTYEAGERGQGSYRTSGHDVYRGLAATAAAHGTDMRLQPRGATAGAGAAASATGAPAATVAGSQSFSHHLHHQPLLPTHTHHPAAMGTLSRPYLPEPHERMPYPPYGRLPDEPPLAPSSLHQMASYPPPSHLQGPMMPAYAPYLPPLPGPASMQRGYMASPHLPAPTQIPSPVTGPPGSSDSIPPYGSPKSQRKTKGHVASACVPCKRAHLRCDAQRPCARCMSNGKEDACVDVQHKKRGRPRLREERDLRPGPTSYGQSAASLGSEFVERGSAADANAYPAPASLASRVPEPAAFLTLDLELAKASSTFLDAIGRLSVNGLSLLDVVSPVERDRAMSLQRQMQDERQRKDPQYLPPIFAQHDKERVMQSLGFAADDLARYALDWQEFLTFVSVDGQQRTFPVRMGLAKQDSIYFIVLLLQVSMRSPLGPATALPMSRGMPYGLQHAPPALPPQHQHPQHQHPHPQHQMYGSSVGSAPTAYEMGRPRMHGDTGLLPQHPTTSAGGPSAMSAGPSMGGGMSSGYGPSLGRADYAAAAHSSYQTPRGDPVSGPLPHRQPPHQQHQQLQQQQQQQQVHGQPPPAQPGGSGYHLPPIRQQPDPRAALREDKSRVDIGGLIDRPDPPRR